MGIVKPCHPKEVVNSGLIVVNGIKYDLASWRLVMVNGGFNGETIGKP
jgi:hypothetical protein